MRIAAKQVSVWVILLLLALALAVPAAAASTAVFINEIHYDNDGTDAGEAIEIAGPAGTDLTGWSLVLYNGNGGAVYATTALSGVIPDQQNGFGTVSVAYPANGIQNGSPDGLALVDPSSTVVQFLSYEGAFTAVGGPADGLTSVDIGVSEASTTPLSYSLQLAGTGTVYEDFTWSGPIPATFGAGNTLQSFTGGPPSLAPPVINEFVANHVGTDTNEYIEVFGDPGADYSAFTLLQIEGDGTGAGVVDMVILLGATDAGGFFWTGYLNNALENGTLTLLLAEGFTGAQGADLDTDNDGILDSAPWTAIVDSVAVNDGGVGDQVYSSVVLGVAYDGFAFVPGGASRIPDGVDTDATADWMRNDFDGAGIAALGLGTPVLGEAINTPGAGNRAFIPLAINEIDYDQPSTDSAEFIELFNLSASPLDLTGFALRLINGTGGGASVYITIDLSGYTVAAGGYFVVCANAATIANCDLDVSPDANLIQNGAPDAVALVFGSDIVDTVSYEGDTGAPYTEGSGAGLVDDGVPGLGISRCPNGVDTDQNNADFRSAAITPGAENACGPVIPPFGVCGDPATLIHAVQGGGPASPEVGNIHTIEGVVVGDFQNTSTQLSGFFLQEEDGQADADPATSEGIFVYDPAFTLDVAVGDVVRVQGAVTEFFGLTELTSVTNMALCSSGSAVTPAAITLPVSSLDYWEQFEGMLITIPQTLYVTENYTTGRYGEVHLSIGGRLFNPTSVTAPGAPALALQDLNDRSRIQLDDGSAIQNPLPLPPYLGPDNTLRGGDTLPGITGVLSYGFGEYEIQPVGPVAFTRVNERSVTPPAVGGTLKVASFNVLNYFTTIDNAGPICGPTGGLDCRGADTIEEFTRQRDKIISALIALDADIVGLMEIENHATDAAVIDLVDGLNAIAGAGVYAYISTGPIGTDAIKVALIYKPAAVTPVGAYAIIDSTVDPTFIDTLNRPSLAQTFDVNATGARFTVVVNHLKSKGSDCNAVGDPDTGDGQGNCNLTRTAAANALVNWLAADPTGSGDPDFLIIGDLNSYAMEDPITAITGAGYTNLVSVFGGLYAYSYVFEGQAGYLDHALSSPTLTLQVTGAAEWHINADEPAALDYNNYNQPLLYQPDPFRASDHDPVLVGLDLNAPPVCTFAAPSAVSLWPADHRFAPVEVLGVTDPNGDPVTITITGIFQDEPVDDTGDGAFAPDALITGPGLFELRAERAGTGTGRFYHISFLAEDGRGGSCTGEVVVVTPFSQNQKVVPVDEGPLYDSTLAP
jgi:hypothetical protein